MISVSDEFISIHVPAWGTTENANEIKSKESNFNPRSRVGNDRLNAGRIASARISIHVPAWGTTASNTDDIVMGTISIHVPAWGTTAKLNNFNSIFLYIQYKFLFNHCFFHYFLLCQFYL